MLKKLLAILQDNKSSWKLLWGALFIGVTFMFVFNSNKKPPASASIAINPTPIAPNFKEEMSFYDRFASGQVDRSYNLDPRIKIIEGSANPLRMLYKEKKPLLETKKEEPAAKPVKKPTKAPPKETWGQSINVQKKEKQERKYFKAIFRESQVAFNGKQIKMELLEEIPELDLEEGIVLKGQTTFLYSGRVQIHVTAAGESRKQISLWAVDAEDLQEGIYHDQLARQIEEQAKESATDELFDFDFKGKKIAKKVRDITKISKKISIEEGREVLLYIDQIPQKD